MPIASLSNRLTVASTFPPLPPPRSIPVSTSHTCVFAAVAVGLFEGRKGVNWWMVLQTICAVSLGRGLRGTDGCLAHRRLAAHSLHEQPGVRHAVPAASRTPCPTPPVLTAPPVHPPSPPQMFITLGTAMGACAGLTAFGVYSPMKNLENASVDGVNQWQS